MIKFPFIILVYVINKGLSTEERIKQICDFKSKRLKTIIATDALNRGIDLNVDIII
jgi:superfamily II DNA/RNA helicase